MMVATDRCYDQRGHGCYWNETGCGCTASGAAVAAPELDDPSSANQRQVSTEDQIQSRRGDNDSTMTLTAMDPKLSGSTSEQQRDWQIVTSKQPSRQQSLAGATSKPMTWWLMANCLLFLAAHLVQAGFWTFYFPNIFKPSGYNELTSMIDNLRSEIYATKDNFSDMQYFWGLLQEFDHIDESLLYPEESACSEVFPLFRDLAIEYVYIDYEHFIKPMEMHLEHLLESREKWFPAGPKSKTVLPREWEQKLYERELELKIEWHSRLTNGDEFRSKRERLVRIWKSVKRGLDTSLACVYLRYAYRQISEDINQFALDMNLAGMHQAMEMVETAYKRIRVFKGSDQEAAKMIAEAMQQHRDRQSTGS